MAISDGYILFVNQYDDQIYCVGPGPSATTVTAPDVAIPQGTKVVIKGTITDAGPGQTCLGIPAKGTPAIADANQEQWMEYLYEQQAKPTNATGVPVTLTCVDPNSNTENIGTVTSNSMGIYAFAWTPPVPGMYFITASFAGSNSYGPSQAGTSLYVTAAAPAAVVTSTSSSPTPSPVVVTPPPTTVVTVAPTPSPVIIPPTSATPTMTYIAIAAAVIIVAVIAAALVLRRRK